MSYPLSSILTYGAAAAMLATLRAERTSANPTSGAGSPATSATLVDQKPSAEAIAMVAFWREAGPGRWFAKDPEFDRTFREQFLSLHEAAERGELVHWLTIAGRRARSGAAAGPVPPQRVPQYPAHVRNRRAGACDG